MTIRSKLEIDLSNKEKTSGMTYVLLSRSTDINNVCIGQSIPFDRLKNLGQSSSHVARMAEEDRLKSLWEDTKNVFMSLPTNIL
jgi:hypothetical protein